MSWDSFDAMSYILFTIILYFLSVLSKRLGEVMALKRYYYLYYAGMVFTFSGSIVKVIFPADSGYFELIEYGFFAVGLTFGIIASIKYWGWLIKELIKG